MEGLHMDVWQVLTGIVAVLAWFLRLEGRVKQLERENELKEKVIEAQVSKHVALESRVNELFATIQATLARIEAKVEALEKN